jgi:hypothetical protein
MLSWSCVSIDWELNHAGFVVMLEVPSEDDQTLFVFVSCNDLDFVVNTGAQDVDDFNVAFKVAIDVFEFILMAFISNLDVGNFNVLTTFYD